MPPEANGWATAAGSAYKYKGASRSEFFCRVPRNVQEKHEMLVQRLACLCEVQINKAPVIRLAGCHHDVINRGGEVEKKLFQLRRFRGIEGCCAQRIELACGTLQALGIAAGEDYLCAFRPCPPGGLEPNTRASADHDNGLIQEFRFPVDVRDFDAIAHGCSDL
jgi:hypothetical protein